MSTVACLCGKLVSTLFDSEIDLSTYPLEPSSVCTLPIADLLTGRSLSSHWATSVPLQLTPRRVPPHLPSPPFPPTSANSASSFTQIFSRSRRSSLILNSNFSPCWSASSSRPRSFSSSLEIENSCRPAISKSRHSRAAFYTFCPAITSTPGPLSLSPCFCYHIPRFPSAPSTLTLLLSPSYTRRTSRRSSAIVVFVFECLIRRQYKDKDVHVNSPSSKRWHSRAPFPVSCPLSASPSCYVSRLLAPFTSRRPKNHASTRSLSSF